MTAYPYATAAVSLGTDSARSLFAKLSQVYRGERPAFVRDIVTKGRRKRP